MSFLSLIYLATLFISDLYNHFYDFREPKNYRKVLLAGLLAGLLVIVIFYFPMGKFIGRYFLVIQIITFTSLLFVWRYCFSAFSLAQRLKKKVLIVGAGSSGAALLRAIRKRRNSGLWVKGLVDDDPRKIGAEIEGYPVLGNSRDLPARADLFCLPSAAEGFSMAVLEALASGTPVLLSPGCHFPEMERAGAGKIAPPDPDSLAAALARLLAEPDSLKLMGESGLNFVTQNYSWDRITDQLVQVYLEDVRNN